MKTKYNLLNLKAGQPLNFIIVIPIELNGPIVGFGAQILDIYNQIIITLFCRTLRKTYIQQNYNLNKNCLKTVVNSYVQLPLNFFREDETLMQSMKQ